MSETQTVDMVRGADIVGNLGREAELKYTSAGKAIFTFSMAVSFDYKEPGKDDWTNRTAWYRVNAFEALAEELQGMVTDSGEPLFSKGTRVRILEPVFKMTAWNNDAGEARVSMDVTVKRRSQIEIVQRLKRDGASDSWGPPVESLEEVPF